MIRIKHFLFLNAWGVSALVALGRAGGGGSGAGGAGGGSGGYGAGHQIHPYSLPGRYFTVPIIGNGAWAFWLVVSIILGILGLYVSRKIRRRIKRNKTRKLLRHLMTIDPVWEERRLKEHAKSSFYKIQQAWCDQDLLTLDALLTTPLYKEWRKRIRKLKKHGHRDQMSGTKILRFNVINVQDFLDNDRDNFTVELRAYSQDQTLDRKGQVIDVRPAQFSEFWTYQRKGGFWLLHRIRQLSDTRQVMKPNRVEKETTRG